MRAEARLHPQVVRVVRANGEERSACRCQVSLRKGDYLMKTILCYGDSNTWGYDPATTERLNRDTRWPGVLRKELGEGHLVIEEGLNGRTTVWDDPIEGYKNGKEYLIPCLETHKPLDLVVIMLGTNDLKKRFSLSAFDIAYSAGVLVDVVRKSEAGPEGAAPGVLLVCPPPVGKLTEFAEMFEGAEGKSCRLGGWFRQVAQEQSCKLLDAGEVVTASDLDGIHLEADEHRELGRAVAAVVRRMLG
jgi:lysophospholipase L1-like esterase